MRWHFEEKLHRRFQSGNLRKLKVAESLVDFCSNDYLGLARSSVLAAAVNHEWSKESSELNGLGSTGSRLLTGNSRYAEQLEASIAEFHGYDTGTIFGCGYMANVGLLSTIAGDDDAYFFDAGVHASMREGIRLSSASAYPFRHNDVQSLEKRLQNCRVAGNRFICVESIYSTDGSVAPLEDICRLARQYDAHVIVDEAHAVAVCGPEGRGLVAQHGLMAQVFAQVVTFGKGVGAYGAIVLGNTILKEALVNFATSFVYTTALPSHALYAIKCSYDLFPKLHDERHHLQQLISLFPADSSTHIQVVEVPGNNEVRRIAQILEAAGYDVRPLMSPTVQRGHEVLRICLHAYNTRDQVKELLTHCEGAYV